MIAEDLSGAVEMPQVYRLADVSRSITWDEVRRTRVLYVAEDRKQSSLDGFWDTLTVEEISGIEAVAMDMWDPYIASVREHVPEADCKIVFDKFHVAQHLAQLSHLEGFAGVKPFRISEGYPKVFTTGGGGSATYFDVI